MCVIYVFIDLKKAFDTVNHGILLHKLEHYGICESALLWFKSYLSDRKQYAHLNGVDFDMKGTTCGVPQGSVLGPLLFFISMLMISPISLRNLSSIYLLTTLIYLESDDLQSLEKIMNKELGKLFEWLCINRLSLNISKTNFIIFCPVNKSKIPATILINKEAIDEVAHVKYLGILIDSQLTFKQHIGELKNKLQEQLGYYIK